MEFIPFVQFTFNTQYILRWITGGIMLYIPVLNFFSLGYLAKASRIFMIGTVGLPTWENKNEIWMEGIKLLYILILYEAIPCFLFSFSFLLISLHSFTAFFGNIIKYAGFLALFVCSFFIPFAFATFSEQMDFREALEFQKISKAIKEVFIQYVAGYLCAMAIVGVLFVTVRRIPYLIGLSAFSILTYFTLLLATYYFTRLYTRTSLSSERTEGKGL